MHPEEQLEDGTHLAPPRRATASSFRNFGEGFELAGVDEEQRPGTDRRALPDQRPHARSAVPQHLARVSGIQHEYPRPVSRHAVHHEIEEVREGGAELPQFLFIHLPNDHMAGARPADGYPYRESFVADNDYALGRIVEYLSGRKGGARWRSS